MGRLERYILGLEITQGQGVGERGYAQIHRD